MTPFSVKRKTSNESIPVPCGKCPACLARRVSGWSFRLMQEEKVSTSAHFITLTYDTSHVPITENGFMGLNKRDLQLFFKRLRKAHGDISVQDVLPIKYYAVGEYGGRTKRPHYHIILFNAKLELIQDAWNLGSVHYGDVTGASVGYTLKYISKKGLVPIHRNDDRLREFSLMSKGLGKSYLSWSIVDWHWADMNNRMYVTTADGKKVSMPRYYKQKLYHDDERKVIGFHARKYQVEQQKKLMDEVGGCEIYWNMKAESDMAEFRKHNVESKKRDQL